MSNDVIINNMVKTYIISNSCYVYPNSNKLGNHRFY